MTEQTVRQQTPELERQRFDLWAERNRQLMEQLDHYWSSADIRFIVWEAAITDLNIRNRP